VGSSRTGYPCPAAVTDGRVGYGAFPQVRDLGAARNVRFGTMEPKFRPTYFGLTAQVGQVSEVDLDERLLVQCFRRSERCKQDQRPLPETGHERTFFFT
jgi:hypothetical protein